MNINELGLFDYNGKKKTNPLMFFFNIYFSRIFSEIYSTTKNQNKEKREEKEEEKINIGKNLRRKKKFFFYNFLVKRIFLKKCKSY